MIKTKIHRTEQGLMLMIPDEMLKEWALHSEFDVSITIQAQQIIITPSSIVTTSACSTRPAEPTSSTP
ncbi:hypothetical protein QUF63_13430 [Anaerolineales bacterium HSG25]|nr:hypothetical protein [Anaerolineales bacterium HSG25]